MEGAIKGNIISHFPLFSWFSTEEAESGIQTAQSREVKLLSTNSNFGKSLVGL